MNCKISSNNKCFQQGVRELNENLEKYLLEYKKVATERIKDPLLESSYSFVTRFFKRENLEKATWKDFQELGSNTFCYTKMPLAGKKAFGNPNHPIEKYRNTFLYLFYGEEPTDQLKAEGIQERLHEVRKNEKYKLQYLGTSFYSEILFFVLPDHFALWNQRSRWALEFLGEEVPLLRKWNNFICNFSRCEKLIYMFLKSLCGIPLALSLTISCAICTINTKIQ
jgi:5-methylcytosine-specific restriction enzyme B